MPVIPLGGHFYQSDSLPVAAQECVNLYASIPQVETPQKKVLFPTPGIRQATTAGNDHNRGAHVFGTTPYFVQGDTLYSISRSTDAFGDVTYSSSAISGTIGGSGKVIMTDNGSQLCILAPDSSDSQNAYIYTGSGSVDQITDGDFDGPASSVTFIDGYFVFTKKDSRKFFISNLRDGTTYTSTDFETSEADPDNNVGAFPLGDTLYVFGTQTMQPYQNVGGDGFPFQAIQGGLQRKGLSSQYAITQQNDFLVFLGKDENETPSMWASGGGRPEKISTIAIDNEISRYPEDSINNCFVWKYAEAGAQFVGFTFPEERTFVYDFTSQEWHTRESADDMGNQIRWRISTVLEAFDVMLVGDRFNSNIGILDRDIYDEYDREMRRSFVTPQIDNDGESFFISKVYLLCESGVGATTGQGETPLVSLSLSKDGGRTFNNRIERTAGKIGEYKEIPTWRQLGRTPEQACFKFEVSDPVKWVFRKVSAEIE